MVPSPNGRGLESPNRPKSVPKTDQQLRRFIFKSDKLLFKSLLEPSWADLGPLRPPKSCCGPHGARFFKKHVFSTNRARKRNLGVKSAENERKKECENAQHRPASQEEHELNNTIVSALLMLTLLPSYSLCLLTFVKIFYTIEYFVSLMNKLCMTQVLKNLKLNNNAILSLYFKRFTLNNNLPFSLAQYRTLHSF